MAAERILPASARGPLSSAEPACVLRDPAGAITFWQPRARLVLVQATGQMGAELIGGFLAWLSERVRADASLEIFDDLSLVTGYDRPGSMRAIAWARAYHDRLTRVDVLTASLSMAVVVQLASLAVKQLHGHTDAVHFRRLIRAAVDDHR